MIQYTNDFLIYKRDHLLFANCSIHFHMNKFLVSMFLQFISCLVGNRQTTKIWVYTLVMFSAGVMRNILSLHIKFLVICTAKIPYNIWKRIGHYGHSLRPQVRRENRVRAHNWSKSLLKKYYFLYALAQTKYFVNSFKRPIIQEILCKKYIVSDTSKIFNPVWKERGKSNHD